MRTFCTPHFECLKYFLFRIFAQFSTLEAHTGPNIEIHQVCSYTLLFVLVHANILRTPLCMFDQSFLRHFFAPASTLEAYIGPNFSSLLNLNKLFQYEINWAMASWLNFPDDRYDETIHCILA
jgi:hypothetical protein